MSRSNSSRKISRRKFLEISALATAGVLTGFSTVKASLPAAEMVLINGKIITVDAKDSITEGVAVRGGKIIATGVTEKISKYIYRKTRVIDLKGKTVTPGLIDSHAHLPPFGQRENGWLVKLQGMDSKEEVMETLAQKARKLPKGEWISAPLYQPQIALWQAIKRTTRSGSRVDSAESISIQEALKMQTMGSAYSGFQEKEIGSLEIGKLADMVVWDRDYYIVSRDEIKDVKAVMTFVGGRSVYERT
ncbi:MAG: amidohydrolase family protein [Syntrophales bacterium]|nr:amidohydrolase family protein [Syntrophales bacterium]